MSSIFERGGRLYLRVKDGAGNWKKLRTTFVAGEEAKARELLDQVEARREAGEEVGEAGPITVKGWSVTWLKRREREVLSWRNDRATLERHVLPKLGALQLDEVRARQLVELVKGWRAKTGDARMAPRTIYTAWSTVCAMFRDAALDGLIAASPCKLTKRQLGPKVDKDPEFRAQAVFTAAELETLISDALVPMDRRTLYALEGVAGLRHGEAAGLLWRNVRQAEAVPYLLIAFSYERAFPKGDVVRPVPIHPTLAAVLGEWKLHGWREMFGRAPGPDDLVLPVPPTYQTKRGQWRRKEYSHQRLGEDLAALNFRHRRGHDLRRTFISLARSHGAQRDILRRATHKPVAEVIEGYTTFELEVVAEEVAKLRVQRRGANVVALPLAIAVGAEAALGADQAATVASRTTEPKPGRDVATVATFAGGLPKGDVATVATIQAATMATRSSDAKNDTVSSFARELVPGLSPEIASAHLDRENYEGGTRIRTGE